MQKITRQNNTLIVPDNPIIPFIEGDGIGKEITSSKTYNRQSCGKAYGGKRKIEWKEMLAGEKAYNKVGSWLPPETMESF